MGGKTRNIALQLVLQQCCKKKAARFLLPVQSQSSLTWVLISKHPKEDKRPKSAAKNTKKYELGARLKGENWFTTLYF